VFDGFLDVSPLLRCGVYILTLRGKVVYVGKAKQMLARIYQHRELWVQARRGTKMPSFLAQKGVQFDAVYVKPCHPDRVDSLERELIARYRPKYNTLLQPPPGGCVTIEIGGMPFTVNTKPKAGFVRRA
jgi:excinuclease UvrABC nuclease subunit